MKNIQSKSYVRKVSQFMPEYGETMPNNPGGEPVGGNFDPNDGQQTFYVRVYGSNRAYGGPEEGGWWYDDNELVKEVVVNNEAEADMKRDQLEAMYRDKGEDSYTQDLSRMSHPSDNDPMDDSDQTEPIGFKGSTYDSYFVSVETSSKPESETTETPYYS